MTITAKELSFKWQRRVNIESRTNVVLYIRLVTFRKPFYLIFCDTISYVIRYTLLNNITKGMYDINVTNNIKYKSNN